VVQKIQLYWSVAKRIAMATQALIPIQIQVLHRRYAEDQARVAHPCCSQAADT
jgi:hypothetical protein